MADVVKWLTHWIVVPTCVGSIPTVRPIENIKKLKYASFSISTKKVKRCAEIMNKKIKKYEK